MKRREFIGLLGIVRHGRWPRAQRSAIPTIGVLVPGSPSSWSCNDHAFRGRLNELGWKEGHSVVIQTRWSEGRTDSFVEIVEEFVRARVDVIVTGGTLPVLAAKRVTSEIPVVFAGVGNPVGAGLVATLAKPGANVTGVSNQTPELAGKRVARLRTAVSGLSRLAILGNADSASVAQEMAEAQAAAKALGIQDIKLVTRRAEQISPAFEGLSDRADGIYVVVDPLIGANQVLINTLALNARLPTMHGDRNFVATGGLLSYGANLSEGYRRVADFVDRILRGTKPADIPVEQPTSLNWSSILGLPGNSALRKKQNCPKLQRWRPSLLRWPAVRDSSQRCLWRQPARNAPCADLCHTTRGRFSFRRSLPTSPPPWAWICLLLWWVVVSLPLVGFLLRFLLLRRLLLGPPMRVAAGIRHLEVLPLHALSRLLLSAAKIASSHPVIAHGFVAREHHRALGRALSCGGRAN